VRVGFIHHLLWERYGDFWVTLSEAVGAEAVFPDAARVAEALSDARTASADALAFRLAIASALSLDDVDVVVAPQLNPADGTTRGSAQDPWIAEFPTMLARAVGSLPVLAVPATLEDDLASEAVAFLHRLTPDSASVRRAWSQHRAAARLPRPPGLPHPPAGRNPVALLGAPWWTQPRVAGQLGLGEEFLWGPWMLPAAALREEGWRLDERLTASDAEALGALRRFARSGAQPELRWLTDEASGSEAWLLRRALQLVGDRLVVVELGGQATPERWAHTLLARP
jgi:hypothetical protein